MFRAAARPALACAVAMLPAGAALAQVAPLPPRIEVAPGTVIDNPDRVFGDDAPAFSPLAIVGALGLSVSAGANLEYNSNVARAANGETISSRFESKDDWIFRPSIGLSGERAFGRQRLFFDTSVGRTFYIRNSDLNANRFQLGGGVDLSLGQSCGGQVRGGFSTRDTQLTAFEEVYPSTSKVTSFGASVNCRTVTGIGGGLGYNRSKSRNRTGNPNTDRSFADVNSQSFNGNLSYAVGVRGSVGLNASWTENEYPKQLLATGDANRNTIKSFGFFGRYRIGQTLSASASLSRTNLDSNAPGSTGFSGNSWGIGISYGGPRIGANLSTGQSVNGGSGGSANYSISRYVNASATYRLNDAMNASAGWSRSNSDYRGVAQVPETEAVQQGTSNRFFVGADYRLNSILGFSVDLNHLRRSADPAEFGYEATSVTFGVRARF